jgi:hypothetical protein
MMLHKGPKLIDSVDPSIDRVSEQSVAERFQARSKAFDAGRRHGMVSMVRGGMSPRLS